MLDPDANEAEARKQDPSLAQIDRKKQIPKENENAVREVVEKAFGSKEALNEAFDQLSPFVKDKVGGRLEERIQFFVRMRLYFDSWKELLDHFSEENLVPVKRGKVAVVLAKDAAEHLERGLDVLEKMGHPFPSITVGFGLRGFYKGEFQGAGLMIHALGYAFDVDAARNPKIGYSPEPGPQKLDLYHVSTVIPENSFIDMGDMNMNSSNIVADMGKRTAAGKEKDISAEEDKDPRAREYFKRFRDQFFEMKLGSLNFVSSISDKDRTELLGIRDAYYEKQKELDSERAKIKRGAPGTANPRIAQLEEDQRRLLARIPTLVTQWVKFLDREIDKILKKHPEMSKMRPPAEISGDLKAAEAELRQAKAAEPQARAAETKAWEDREKAWEKLQPDDIDDQEAMDKLNAPRGISVEVPQAKERLAEVTRRRDKLSADLKESNKFNTTWPWLTSYRELRSMLSGTGLDTPAGQQKFERLMIGDPAHKAPPENPPLLRLLDTGIFNPDDAFDLKFFEEMIHSGFVAGATWNPGWTDPMHFELQEGRNKIRSAGIDAPAQHKP